MAIMFEHFTEHYVAEFSKIYSLIRLVRNILLELI